MSSKLGTAEIHTITPTDPADPNKVEVRVDGATIETTRDYVDHISHGKAFSFRNLPFETTADRRRAGEQV